MMATEPLGQWRSTASSATMGNHYTKKRIIFIHNKVNKIFPYSNPIKPRQKA